MRRRTYGGEKVDKNTVVLAHLDGNMTDTMGHDYTVIGGANAFTQGKFNKGITNSGTNISTYYNNVGIDLRYSDVTIECFVMETSISKGVNTGFRLGVEVNLINQYSQLAFNFRFSGGMLIAIDKGHNWTLIYTTVTLPLNTWVHLAFSVKNKIIKIFVDGICQYTSDSQIFIGGFPLNATIVNDGGHVIDEFRVSNIARYTANFTPPTKPF